MGLQPMSKYLLTRQLSLLTCVYGSHDGWLLVPICMHDMLIKVLHECYCCHCMHAAHYKRCVTTTSTNRHVLTVIKGLLYHLISTSIVQFHPITTILAHYH